MGDENDDLNLDSVSTSSIKTSINTSINTSDDLSSDEDSQTVTSKRRKRNIQVLQACIIATVYYFKSYLHKTPCHDREYSGWAALMSMLNGNPRRCRENLRMRIETFFQFCQILVDEYGLRPMRSVTVEEQVATFLMITGPRQGNRQLQETLQRSGYTISRSFHRVLKACTKMSIDWIIPFTDQSVTHDYIRLNERYFPHFKDCIGAIDGTHIKAVLPKDSQVPYIGRKETPTQNIMVACDFDMCFTFVLPGWEGSAHDTRIFYDTIRNPDKRFPMPIKGKYYLVDAGYPNMPGFLAPYKGQKYHLPDFRRATTYNNHYEVFNHLHSSIRSTIERSFGCWKGRFYMINDIPVNVPWEDQVALVPATMAIHNFIRKVDALDEEFLQYDNDPDYIPQGEDEHGTDTNTNELEINSNDGRLMDRVRDDISASISFSRIGIPIP